MAAEETELKFTLDAAALAALRAELFADAEPVDLVSTYYDTAGRDLARRSLALRVRSGPQGWVQTIKSAGALTRYEDEAALATEAPWPERLADAPGGEGLGPAPDLLPVCRVSVSRRTVLRDHGAARIEWALDEGVAQAGAFGVELRELELELKSGDLTDLFAAGHPVAGRAGVLLSLVSKAERGFRLADGGVHMPWKAEPPRLDDRASVRDGFQAAALGALGALCANLWRLRTEAEDAEAVHQARVALRRLRAFISAFEPLVAGPDLAAVKAKLKRITALLADARSLDVFAQSLPADEATAELGRQTREALQRVHARTRDDLAAPEVARGVLEIAEWIVAGPWTVSPAAASVGAAPLAPYLKSEVRRRRRKLLRRAKRLDWSAAHPRHKLRIRAKKLRYLLDTFPATAGSGDGFLTGLKRLQEHLGMLNDLATADQAARLALDGAPLSAAFDAGLFVAERRARAPKLIRKARKAARRLRRIAP